MNCKTTCCDCQATEFPFKLKVSVSPDCGCEEDTPGCCCGNGEGNGGGGRIRVSKDLHIYVDGGLSGSGDGLSSETAVRSYAEAVDVLNRHDGCGKYRAWIHFASLADGKEYPAIEISLGMAANFVQVYFEGEDCETTIITQIIARGGDCVLANLCTRSILCERNGKVTLNGQIGILPPSGLDVHGSISAWGGAIDLRCEVLVKETDYRCLLGIASTGILRMYPETKIHVDGQHFSAAFVECVYSGVLRSWNASFVGSATGKRYNVGMGGCIRIENGGPDYFPGNVSGTNDGGYYFA